MECYGTRKGEERKLRKKKGDTTITLRCLFIIRSRCLPRIIEFTTCAAKRKEKHVRGESAVDEEERKKFYPGKEGKPEVSVYGVCLLYRSK